MINFLKDYGITDNVIKNIEKINSESNIYNLSCNQDEVVKIIQFLKGLSINCIDKLLIYRIDKFFLSFEDFKNLFSKKDMTNLINLINDDYTIIDRL